MRLPVHVFDVLESTSTKAAELLAGGMKPPFAVTCAEQTGGRGRRGKTWTSARGNLFLTVVLPASYTKAEDRGLVPLKAGILAALFFRQKLHMAVSLKWPNDLLMAGCKLGGILCESSTQGDQWGDILIGVGINVASSPELPPREPAAVALNDTGAAVVAHEFVESLAQDIAESWLPFEAAKIPEAFEALMPAGGRYWLAKNDQGAGSLAFAEGITDVGALRLRRLCGELVELASVDHEFRNLYQKLSHGDQRTPLVIADVGNSQIKLAFFSEASDRDPLKIWSGPANEIADVLRLELRPLLLSTLGLDDAESLNWPLFVASVSPVAYETLSAAAELSGFRGHLLEKRRLHSWGEYPLAELGADRLALIEGYLATHARNAGDEQGSAILVACGTATTIDLVRNNGEHLGGYILPGLTTALGALHQQTALLPDLSACVLPTVRDLGRSTRTAMQQGVLQMTAGAVMRAAATLTEETGDARPQVVITGGLGRHLLPQIHELPARSEASLILLGIRSLVLG